MPNIRVVIGDGWPVLFNGILLTTSAAAVNELANVFHAVHLGLPQGLVQPGVEPRIEGRVEDGQEDERALEHLKASRGLRIGEHGDHNENPVGPFNIKSSYVWSGVI